MYFVRALQFITVFFILSNAIATTHSIANYDRSIGTAGVKEIRTDLLPLGPRSLSSRDLSTLTKIIFNTRILHNNLTISLPSATTISQLTTFYTQISSTILRNIASAPKHHLTLTLGAYRVAFSCLTEALPWQLLNDIVLDMREWMRNRWTPVAAWFSFLGVNPYLVAAPAVIVVSISLLVPLVRDLLEGNI